MTSRPDLERELAIAIDAVRAAARVCRAVQERLVSADTLEKRDRSPVTVADFASQAVVCARLGDAFPRDPVVGEEDAAELREDGNAALRAAVVERVAAEVGADAEAERVLEWIDRGGDDATGARFWALDPIDGTKGFLRREQYAVALGLIRDGEVCLGVLGCPNLPGPGSKPGVLFAATRAGARAASLWDANDEGAPIAVEALRSAAAARFCESVESGHSDQDTSAEVARKLGITADPVRMDSQCKYGVVARGEASIYLRLPTRGDYEEKIWDHAAGMIVVEAAGGRVTDIHGKPLDFSRGRTLSGNRGVVATSGSIHDAVLDAIAKTQS